MADQFNPYSAPATPDAPRVAFGGGFPVEAYASQAAKVRVITVFLGAFAVAHLGGIVTNLLELGFLEQARLGLATEAEGVANDSRQLIPIVGTWVTYLASAVLIAMFLHRANKNARALAGDSVPLEYSPGWTVGWFFIPIVNLWKPYSAVREIFSVSRPIVPGMLGLWWAAWVLMSIVGRISQRYAAEPETIDDFVTSNYLASGHAVLAVVSAATCLWMVHALHAAQEAHRATGKPEMPSYP